MAMARSTHVAESLLDLMVTQGGEVCATGDLDGSSSTAGTVSISTSLVGAVAEAGEDPVASGRRLRQLLMCHDRFPQVVSLYYDCKKMSLSQLEKEVTTSQPKCVYFRPRPCILPFPPTLRFLLPLDTL